VCSSVCEGRFRRGAARLRVTATSLGDMAYTTAEGRQELLDSLAAATEELGFALAALGAAYEQLDEHSADRLEEQLFRPVQAAYGRAQRAHAGFAERHGLTTRTFEPAAPGHPSQGVRGYLDGALAAVDDVDVSLADLQDSMRPVEVGDIELRAGLAEVRELVGDLRARARRFVSTLGR
jgi:hypothetical protein